jgi:transcriptional regulator with XRE-family HTH domain
MHTVRAWREYRGMTQDALAAAANVSKPFISQIEGGKRAGSMRTLKKLASALGVGVHALT